VIQCQLKINWCCHIFDFLINFNRFYPYINYSPIFFFNSRHLIKVFPSYHTSCLFITYYAALLVLPRLLAQVFARTYILITQYVILKLGNFFLLLTGSNFFNSLPKIPHCCQREYLFVIKLSSKLDG